jgi:uncharacterized membrane protein
MGAPSSFESAQGEPAGRWSTDRVEAFSDGVFAIAITLLVLDITVAPSEFEDLGKALAQEWPAYLAYVTSFMTVGSVWIAHHSLFARVRFVDPVLLRINLLLLMATAFLPFPTGVLAQALEHSPRAERTAVAFYGVIALLIELLLRASVRHVESHPDLMAAPSEGRPAAEGGAPRAWWGWLTTAVYSLAILVGIFALPKLAIIAYCAIAVRGALVIGGEGRLSLAGHTRRAG